MKLHMRDKTGWADLLFPLLVFAFALAFGSQALAGISTTKHNLSTGGTGSNHLTAGTAEICVFCHTPHGANTSVKAPLWNKALPPSVYTTYSSATSSTIDGTVSLATSVSLACLSCHDGTQAMDNMINAPGSGGYNAAGARLAGATWTANVGASGQMPGTTVAMLSTDLTNDHPVAIQFCGGGLTGGGGSVVSGTCNDGDFNQSKVLAKVVGATQVFWVSTDANATRDKVDFPLFNNSGNVGPSVECASCHDPHSSTNATFLRISNAGSAVCLTCHNK
ncbi:MAG TPA: cytochrome c3 family protein [Novimethylophilus sp.]|jgi:predicted CXXCH cytochrome family protein|uniref:cytochrome c3 family protein n=1 Tax=Novimethylophilus sp. TaxID=2137426 RepID=UPI002F40941F